MSDEMTCVKDTEYGYYFDNIEKSTAFLLREDLAKDAWGHKIHKGSTSYFRLPDDCWITSGKWAFVGTWVDAYNEDQNAIVEDFLRTAVDWPDDISIIFFANGLTAFRTQWRTFLKYWDEFISVEDDCPILMPETGDRKGAIMFTPGGDIIRISGTGQR